MTDFDANVTSPVPTLSPGNDDNESAGEPVDTRLASGLRGMLKIMATVVDGKRDTSELNGVARIVAGLINADDVTVFETDDDGALHAIFSSAEIPDVERVDATIAPDQPLIRAVVKAGQPLCVGVDQSESSCLVFSESVVGASEQLIAPLMRSGVLLGLVVATAKANKRMTVHNGDVFALCTAQLGCCLRQLRLTRVLEDTQSNLRDQFMRAEKMRTMGEMASGVFHDFNNILGAVVGRVQLIHYKTDDEEIKRSLSQIERIALQGAETVKRLQEFSRLHQDHEIGSTDLNRVIEDALEVTRHRWESQAQRRGISYQIDRRFGQDVIVAGVHAQLVDAVANLVRNSLDAMDQGGRLSIETSRSGGVCRLMVRDEGRGMTEDEAKQVFAPFFTTKGNDGTGLGMTVVQDVIRSHEGSITIESKPGVGTTFRIELPVYKDAAKPPRESAEEGGTDGLHLLVVDDDHIILDVVTESLEDAGHNVDSFSHGSDAISALEKSEYDVVITDLGMPDVTGWEVARAAKMHQPQIPVVVISGWGAQFNEDQLGDSGVDAMLAKPFHLQLLRDTIERLAVGDTKGIPTVRT